VTVKPLTIGGLSIAPPFVLAPMAGYTDVAFRLLCRRYGCGLTYTEVVNASGIVHRNGRTLGMLDVDPSERPVVAHIYGADPALMAEAARYIESLGTFDAIDINCGCPVRKIVAKGAGAALIRDPSRIGRIVAAVRDAVSLPVTIKTRIGLTPERINIADIVRAVQDGGGAAIAIHARPASKVHGGPADWSALAGAKAAASIPVIGNGGVSRPEHALAMLRETGVDGVMVGRAAVGNPWFFAEVRDMIAGRGVAGHSGAEHRLVVLEHLQRVIEMKRVAAGRRRKKGLPAEETAVLHFRGHLHRYLSGFARWPEVRSRLNTMHLEEQVSSAIETVLGGDPVRRG
jgi:nifR3 family TIM-barrel protein